MRVSTSQLSWQAPPHAPCHARVWQPLSRIPHPGSSFRRKEGRLAELRALPAEEEEEEEEEEDEESSSSRRDVLAELENGPNFTPDPEGHRAGFVTIIGRPNAGKSTLMNAILGQTLSIVTEKAQTTRHRVLGLLSEPDYQLIFLDTPGIIEDRRNTLEEKMMAAVKEAVRDADALLAIVDATDRPRAALDMIQPGAEWGGPPLAVILNKTDLLLDHEVEELEAWFTQNCRADAVLPISALKGGNVAAVTDWAVSKMPESPSLYPKDIVSEAPERFFVSEIIRRQVFLQYRQEVPYGVAVEVVAYKERPRAKDYIEAHILLEQERQRGILLGRGGSAIKALATAARLEIEEFLGRPVYLELSVKVAEGWRKDAAMLERLGY